jgi:hypothetical protein
MPSLLEEALLKGRKSFKNGLAGARKKPGGFQRPERPAAQPGLGLFGRTARKGETFKVARETDPRGENYIRTVARSAGPVYPFAEP